MALKINRKLQNILRVIGWAVLAVLIVCMAKIFIWERNYYNTKTGEPRSRAALDRRRRSGKTGERRQKQKCFSQACFHAHDYSTPGASKRLPYDFHHD